MRAPWVVDASGWRAWFARRQGATRRRLDRMLAVVRLAALRSGTFTAPTVVEATPEGLPAAQAKGRFASTAVS
jgi:hypothetical protein